MTTRLQHFFHEFDSFELYPSVQHLQNCFKGVLPRFCRVTGALPDCFHDKKLQEDLESLNKSLASGLQINVFGEQDLSVGDFAVLEDVPRYEEQSIQKDKNKAEKLSGKSLQDDTNEVIKTHNVSVNIFVINKEIPKSLEELIDLVPLDLKTNASRQDVGTFLLVKMDDFDKEEKSTEIYGQFHHCVVAFGCEELKNKMCCHIESLIVKALIRMSLFLRKYEQIAKNSILECDLNILGEKEEKKEKKEAKGKVSRAILEFLRSENMFLDLITHNRQEKISKTIHTKQNNQDVNHGKKRNRSQSDVSERQKTKMTTAVEDDEELYEIADIAMETLMRVIRCVSVEEFAQKLNLPVLFCNSLLCEVDFEKALLNSVSKNNRYHIRNRCKQATTIKASDVKKTFKFDYILYKLQDDMNPVFKKAEKVLKSFLKSLQPLSLVMKKMDHEIFDYLTQTEVKDAKDFTCKVFEAPTFGPKLRRELLRIDGVYGVGTFYGQLEIHIDKTKVVKQDIEKTDEENVDAEIKTTMQSHEKQSNNTKKDDERLSEIKTDIADEMMVNAEIKTKMQSPEKQSNNTKIDDKRLSEIKMEIADKMKTEGFDFPYSLRYVLRKPIPLVYRAEPGNKIRNSRRETGTLGGFCEMMGEFCGLTCAHVVGGSVKEKLEIETNGSFQPFSESQTIHCLAEDGKFPLIDIAALKMKEECKSECKKRMEEDCSRIQRIQLTDRDKSIPSGRLVHKFGAVTGFTEGLVASVDYNAKYDTQSVENYIYIIDNVPDWKISNPLNLQSLTTEDTVDDKDEEATIDAATNNPTPYKGMSASGKAIDEVLQASAKQRDDDRYDELAKKICNEILLYVRHRFSVGKNEQFSDVFARQGDSGSVICIHNDHTQSFYTALSMLSAGGLEIEGNGTQYFSFNLRIGIEFLIKQILKKQSSTKCSSSKDI